MVQVISRLPELLSHLIPGKYSSKKRGERSFIGQVSADDSVAIGIVRSVNAKAIVRALTVAFLNFIISL